jgi:hypothetical protein
MRSAEAIKACIEPHFHSRLTQEAYRVETMAAHRLLTYNRLDIAFKLLYLKMQRYDVGFVKAFYESHLNALMLGNLKEPGEQEKIGIQRFMDDFDATFESIKTNGFDASKTLIPLSRNGSIANGAHRVASAIFLDKAVDCVRLDTFDHIYDYDLFYKRGLPSEMLDAAVTTFIEYAHDTYLAFIWPTAVGKDDEIAAIIPSVVYRKSISLTPNGAHNLLSQIYSGEAWLGDEEDDFSGSQGKLVECFKTFGPVRVVAFQAASMAEALAIKERIRALFDVGKHAVHITDTKEEALQTARLVFNANSVHFLNHARPNRFLSTHREIDRIRASLKKERQDLDEVLILDELLLSLYGLREAQTSHYLTYAPDSPAYRGMDSAKLIFDPSYHFYFKAMKFIAFEASYRMKKEDEKMDERDDLRSMEALIEHNILQEKLERLRQSISYAKIRARQKVVEALHGLGLYERVKRIYDLMKGRG